MPDGSYRTIKQPLIPSVLLDHVLGRVTMGVYALDENSIARWLCLDADNTEDWHKLYRLGRTLSQQGIIPYLETSRRGGHLWLFTDSMPGVEMRQFGRQLIHEHELGDIELYPKQDKLTTGVGSLVRLPLGIHRKTGRRYHFITPEGRPLAPTIREQMHVLSQPQRVPQTYIQSVLERYVEPTQPVGLPYSTPVSLPNETLSERIKASISVWDFVSQYVDLDQRGRGRCPFHDDHHPSFQVHPEKNFWHCYAGCGGGSLVDFWMKWREQQSLDGGFTATVRDLRHMLLAE